MFLAYEHTNVISGVDLCPPTLRRRGAATGWVRGGASLADLVCGEGRKRSQRVCDGALAANDFSTLTAFKTTFLTLKAVIPSNHSYTFRWYGTALASPAMGHWGTCPPRLPASYFGNHSLYRLWRVMRTVFCPVENFKRTNTENVQKQRDFCAIFINFWPIFVIFCPVFLRE